MEAAKIWDVIIIGGGPAGLSAAIYTGRALRTTLVIEKKVFGGQIVESDIIENYPGFADPIAPMDLMEQFYKQAERYQVQFENDEVTAIRQKEQLWEVQASETYVGKSIIFAAGSTHRYLQVKGEKALLGRGVSVCATCDAPFFVNRKVAVLGGGDTALTEALHLAKFAAEVWIIHRRDQLRAEKILQERARANSKIKYLWNAEILQFLGNQKLESIEIKNRLTGETQQISFDGAFIAIGVTPSTELIKEYAALDEAGYVISDLKMGTHSSGLFVAGELIKDNGRQVAISAGMGVQAALSCEEYLAAREQ